jgi:oligopeptide/dipeptide ABC transporter ATP-binding protein
MSATLFQDSSQPLLEFRNFRMGFKDENSVFNLIDDLSFCIREGTVLGLVGESGCGKSMTSLAVMRLLPPEAVVQAGDIRLNGSSLLAKSAREMEQIRGRDIGMIFQEPMTSLNPVQTVGRQIGEVFRIHRREMHADRVRTETIELLRKVGISNAEQRFEQYPHQLSGGMRQRVMIAIAIACKPQLLIADEPTTALDVTIQAQVLALMQDLKEQSHGSIMLITHNLGVVAETCREAVIMYAGQIVEQGTIESLFDAPAHPYTRGLMASVPSKGDDELYSIPGAVPTLENFGAGCRFAPRCAHRKPHCDLQAPRLVEVSNRQWVACWLYAAEDGATYTANARRSMPTNAPATKR